MKKTKLFLICCLSLLLAFVNPVESKGVETFGKCAMPSVETAFKSSAVVFAGRALGETKTGDVRTFEFQVERYWKGGVVGKKIKVGFRETMRYQAWFQVGERYLVFARRSEEDGRLYDGRCSGTKLLAQAAGDVRKLGKGKAPGR